MHNVRKHSDTSTRGENSPGMHSAQFVFLIKHTSGASRPLRSQQHIGSAYGRWPRRENLSRVQRELSSGCRTVFPRARRSENKKKPESESTQVFAWGDLIQPLWILSHLDLRAHAVRTGSRLRGCRRERTSRERRASSAALMKRNSHRLSSLPLSGVTWTVLIKFQKQSNVSFSRIAFFFKFIHTHLFLHMKRSQCVQVLN